MENRKTKPKDDSYINSVRVKGAKKGDKLLGVVDQAHGVVLELLYDLPPGMTRIGVPVKDGQECRFILLKKNEVMALLKEGEVYTYISARDTIRQTNLKFTNGFETKKYEVINQ